MWTFGAQRIGIASGVAWCLICGMLVAGLAGCDGGGGRRGRVAKAPGSAVDPDDLIGRWKLSFVQIPVEQDFCILDITHKNKKFEAKIVSNDKHEKHPGDPQIKTYEIKDDGQVRLELEALGLQWSYQGKLDGDHIWGTLMMPQYQLTPSKLERTELKELEHTKEPQQITSLPDLLGAENAADKFVALNEFVKKKESYRSPLLVEGYASLAKHFKAEKLSLADIKATIADYRKAIEVWGPRLAPRVDLEMGKALAQQQIEPELAKELLSTAEKQITADYPVEWKTQLADSWITVGDYERGLKLLKPLQDLDPSNPFIRLVYAQGKEKAKDIDEALQVYAGLATLPQFERIMASQGSTSVLVLPSEAVARLWKEKHGSTTGLDKFLSEAYESQMKLYVPQRTITKPEPNAQVVLMEVFTGSSCDPCVPVDIAAEALHRAFSPQEMIVVKYHEHAPLADPLANEGGMERFGFYSGRGTPMMVVNGQQVQGVGGNIMAAASQTMRLKMGLEPELKKTAPVSIKLAATREGDEIKIKASVSGIKTTDNDPRLFLVLVENGIQFAAPNGIRLHNGVARAFPNGAAGVKLAPGPEVEHEATVSLTKVRADLAAHLKQFEDQAGREFPSKPMELAKLQVVAFVQNHITKSYMQATLVDVPDATAAPAVEPAKEPTPEPAKEKEPAKEPEKAPTEEPTKP